ncbi:hypothetical protein DXG01_004883, partial [Tephrocybe rancida]
MLPPPAVTSTSPNLDAFPVFPILSGLRRLYEGPDGVSNACRCYCNPTTNVSEVAKPTRGEYAGEAAKEFLTILEAIAVAVPVPGFGIVVKLALNIIKACE